ncbi:transcription factor [Ganoderma sinense ZZ0214-1]|uniref:Transcription activator of gluconeogenesis ERT1 n=1 Tax=Ganoderma sinense ZZ0214-1 TaxID=1077348 RepID=A0A2G8SC80_9APHY|nr:transcription factor [Ganoderma sinense ZZ0214-1]
MYQHRAPHSEVSLALFVIMHSPLQRPPSATAALFPSEHSIGHHHVEAPNDMHSSSGQQHIVNTDVIGWPWCQSCRPLVQILLGQGTVSIGPTSTPTAPWALSSPFPEYVCVPALVHRSQLALFAPSVQQPPSPALPPQEQTGVGAPSNAASVRQRKARGVKIACTNCRLANKKCDDGRPCERCKKNGLAHSCVSAERKQRNRRVRQTETTTMTVSATQVSMERSTISKEDPTTTTTVHIAAGTSYVDDTQEPTDAVNHSSPSESSMAAGDYDAQSDAAVPPSTGYAAVHANFWASLGSYPTPGSDAQLSSWSFTHQGHPGFFDHAMSPTADSVSDYHGLSPTGLEGSGSFPPAAGRHF